MVTSLVQVRRSVRKGDSKVFFAGAALLITIGLVIGVILLLTINGLGFFWPGDLVRVTAKDGTVTLGEAWRSEEIARHGTAPAGTRTLYRVGNRREFQGDDFRWVDDDQVVASDVLDEALLIERLEWGPAIGFLRGVTRDGQAVGGDIDLARFEQLCAEARSERHGALAPTLDQAKLVGTLEISDGRMVRFPLAGVVRVVAPNALSTLGKARVYASRFLEFMTAAPRESNTEGGILPAILGTLLMVLLMSIAVVPLGVITALYLNEYARQGPLVRAVRLAVTNLAGVPSIVFGMFGVAFFIYTLGKGIDTLFFADRLPAPTFGTGGLLWAALTLALLTAPVVIVSTEEALRAVARNQREGSLALGATRWQSLRSVILPAALPGILTGMILAIARGAGEVAPLMLTGVVKLAPDAPYSTDFPFVHFERKFMHLGFHIYDVGFQSPNVEAAKPMVYTTALLLLVLIVALNLTAILYRNRVRRRLQGGVF